MIDGPGQLHWCTLWDEDEEPYGELCRCEVGEDHDESDLATGSHIVTYYVTGGRL